MFDKEKLKKYVAEYKKNFLELRFGKDNEIYKWRAVKHFQDNWNIEASDFPAMLKEAMSKSGNLLAVGNFYPYSAILEFSDKEPETIREMFIDLYNEEAPLNKRVRNFITSANKLKDKYFTKKSNGHFQGTRAISVYLWLKYPNKYYIYQHGVFVGDKNSEGVAVKLKYVDISKIKRDGKPESMLEGYRFYDELCQELKKDEKLVKLNLENCADGYYDKDLKILTGDVGFFISKYDDNNLHLVNVEHTEEKKLMPNYPKNLILYGPPGTGKTYNTVNYAVAIIEGKDINEVIKANRINVLERYNNYKKEGLIEFCTFHQSYGYEEFIEGIKPSVDTGSGVKYEITPGLFKTFCDEAETAATGKSEDYEIRDNPTIWKISLKGTYENDVRTDCMEKSHIRIGYGDDLSEKEVMASTQGILGRFVNDVQIGDIVVSCYNENEFDAIGVIIGECEVLNNYKDYRQARSVKWLVKGIRENIRPLNDGKKMTLASVYRLNSVALIDLLAVVQKYNKTKTEADTRNRVFIIDEINRGNISKIFGELITLLEDSKRLGEQEAMRTRLPYSGKKFGVPNNVYVLGTMNTADRSIALIDTALRRRFKFVEMQPDTDLLKDVVVDGIDIQEMLIAINERIEVLYDREHTIGHSFFMELKDTPKMEVLAGIFANSVFPLLKEYFYDDFEKIAIVLNDDLNQEVETNFVSRKNINIPTYNEIMTTYKFNQESLKNIEAYKKIYQSN